MNCCGGSKRVDFDVAFSFVKAGDGFFMKLEVSIMEKRGPHNLNSGDFQFMLIIELGCSGI